jgi:hypothetical protein
MLINDALCPAGQRRSDVSRLEEKKTGKVDFRIEWNKATCQTCPLRDQCVSSGQSHRSLVVGERHSLLQIHRRELQLEAFKQDMHRRNGIEGTQSEMVRAYGLRQDRSGQSQAAAPKLFHWLRIVPGLTGTHKYGMVQIDEDNNGIAGCSFSGDQGVGRAQGNLVAAGGRGGAGAKNQDRKGDPGG